MALVPVQRRHDVNERERENERDRALQPWRSPAADAYDDFGALWRPFFGGGSLLDPLLLGTRMMSILDPFDAFPLWNYTPSSVFAKDALAVAKTRVDWWESHDAHYIKADLPDNDKEGWGCFLTGTTKDDVEVLVENDRVISVRTRSLGQGRMPLGERSRVGYLRRLPLPANSDASAISAELENMVLTVTIPKRTPTSSEEQNVRVVEIQET